MINRVIDIADTPARLSVRNNLLVIQSGEGPPAMVPPADITALIVSNMQVTYTNAVLSRLAESGAAVVVCDEKHQPQAMLLPLITHTATPCCVL